MSYRILITGSEGLVGTALRRLLEARGLYVVGLDLRARNNEKGDVRDVERVRTAVADCDGVVHLAAVSRVVWAERDPETCWSTNVGGLHNVVDALMDRARPPWLVFASSREVYGQPEILPVTEDAPLRPVNLYGMSKAEGERIVEAARNDGLSAAIVRLSNVYGSTSDYADRVVPAFARAAAQGDTLRVEGADRTFDFTHIDDAARGILALIEILVAGAPVPPPLHFVTGQPTPLGKLAELAVSLARTRSTVEHAPPRAFDVSHFYGSPVLARKLLHWTPQVGIREGLARLIEDFQTQRGTKQQAEATGLAPRFRGHPEMRDNATRP